VDGRVDGSRRRERDDRDEFCSRSEAPGRRTAPVTPPKPLSLAVVPTRIERLSRLSALHPGVEFFVKRDDLTECALSGNKIRKLNALLADALARGAPRTITCGGAQSNHARATAGASARLGLACTLYLRTRDVAPPPRANLLLDRLFGAEVRFVTPDEYRSIDARMAEDARRDGAYVIPEGGSNALGALGLAEAAREIAEHERSTGISFEAVVHAVGSGGTSAGLLLGKALYGMEAEVVGINVCDDEAFFVRKISRILEEAKDRFDIDAGLPPEGIRILDGHVGRGYALSRPEELETIRLLARTEGIVLDPVYTGKAMHGLLKEVRDGRLKDLRRILFLHTGGLFGLFADDDLFAASP
jgi:D-cysteine desulfhydrase